MAKHVGAIYVALFQHYRDHEWVPSLKQHGRDKAGTSSRSGTISNPPHQPALETHLKGTGL